MARTAGNVNNKAASKPLRRKWMLSGVITVSNGATANLVACFGAAPLSNRICVDQLRVINEGAISNHTAGTLKLGHALADGTFDDDSILTAYTLPINSNAKVTTTVQSYSSSFPSTLKTVKGPTVGGRPVVPAGSTLWHTATGMGASGTGTYRLALGYWDMDDESDV